MRERCLELLAESAKASAAKLKFFRLAFGAAGGFGEEIDTREARTALEGLFGAEKKIELGWMVDRRQIAQGSGQGAAQPCAGRRRCAGPRRPARHRGRAGANGTEIVIRAEGPRLLLDPNLRATLERGAAGTVEPRAAGAWLAHALISEARGKLQISPRRQPGADDRRGRSRALRPRRSSTRSRSLSLSAGTTGCRSIGRLAARSLRMVVAACPPSPIAWLIWSSPWTTSPAAYSPSTLVRILSSQTRQQSSSLISAPTIWPARYGYRTRAPDRCCRSSADPAPCRS